MTKYLSLKPLIIQKTSFFIGVFTVLLFTLSNLSQAQVIQSVVGGGTAGLGEGGPANLANLYAPYGVTLDDSNNLYICDAGSSIRIRKVSPARGGIITTIAGNGTQGYSGDGGPGKYAQLYGILDVAVDHKGNVYITDADRIRKISNSDTITTIAGTGIAGYNGDGIPATAAQLNNPFGVGVDSLGNIYIADGDNYRIRKVDTAGIITTIAGNGTPGFSGDGGMATAAQLHHMLSVKMDRTGNLYFCDSARIRKIDTAGIISTFAGTGSGGFGGDGGPATLATITPAAIALDTAGNLFIADENNERIRKVNTTGIINTIAGNGLEGFSGDGGDPLLAKLCHPQGVAVSNSGDIFISDACNERIRVVTMHPSGINNLQEIAQGISVFPNPCHNTCTIYIISATNELSDVVITNITGILLYKFNAHTNQPFNFQPDLAPGVYFINATSEQFHFNQKLIIQ